MLPPRISPSCKPLLRIHRPHRFIIGAGRRRVADAIAPSTWSEDDAQVANFVHGTSEWHVLRIGYMPYCAPNEEHRRSQWLFATADGSACKAECECVREPSCPHVCRVERPEWTSSSSGTSYCPITSTHGYAMHRRALPLVQAYGMHMASGWLPFSQSEGRKSAGIDEMLPNTFRHVHYLLPGRFYQPGMAAFHDSALEAGRELCVKPSIADRGVGGGVTARPCEQQQQQRRSALRQPDPGPRAQLRAAALFCTVVSAYSKLWPSHPLKFLLPYNSEDDITPQLRNGCLRRHSNRIQLVHTADSSIYATIKALLEHTHPRQFVFWATDDYLPVEVPDPKRLDAIAAFVQSASKEQPRLLNCCCCLAGALARTDGPWAPRDGRATAAHSTITFAFVFPLWAPLAMAACRQRSAG